MDARSAELRSSEFRRARQPVWLELAGIVDKAERLGIRALTPAEFRKLPLLYRSTLSSLSVARSTSLDRNLLEHLESLSTRAWLCVYGPQRPIKAVFREIFGNRFPRAFRRSGLFLAASAALLAGGVATAFTLTAADMEWYYTFVPEGMAQGRDPMASTESLRGVLYAGAGAPLSAFAASLFSNNSGVAILCFSTGFLLGVPTAILLFFNGLVLGAMAALYHGRGLSLDFWGWILPHGVTELLAIVVAGGAGLWIGHALLIGDRRSRLDCLVGRGRDAGPLVLGAIGLLVAAAVIEGYFRQMVTSVPVRYGVAGATAFFWICYFAIAGRGRG